MAYIYKITNDINGKIYIGKTERTPGIRFKEHCRDYRNKSHESRPLYKAMEKYGVEHFHCEIIEQTDYPEEREKYWIEYYQSFKVGYNATLGGDGKSYIDYDLIISTYNEIKNIRKVSKLLSIDEGTISKVLKNHNIYILSSSETRSKKVAKIDIKTGEILAIYPSYQEAERQNGNTRHIADVCNGKRKSCKRFFWKYI